MIGFPFPATLPLTLKLYGALALLALVLVLTGGGYLAGRWHGHHAATASAEAKAAAQRAGQLAADNAALRERLAKAAAVTASDQRTVLNLHERLAAAGQHAEQLQRSVSHVRLAICPGPSGRAAAAPGAAAAAGRGDAVVAGREQPDAGPPAAEPAQPGAAAGGDRVALTLAAVGLYDAALYPGEPGAPELAGVACRAAGAAGTAADPDGRCAAASGRSLDDLFRVHIANAAACAADRARLGRLIEAVQARERAYGAAAIDPTANPATP